MVHLTLYKFNKKLNSTKDPVNHVADAQVNVEGHFRIPTSVTNPVIELSENNNVNFYEYNYVYIQEFKRFYFIGNMATYQNIWSMYLKEDLLATYHDSIQESTQYILRSSQLVDPDIIDTFYKTKGTNASGNTKYSEHTLLDSDPVYRINRKTGDHQDITIGDYFTTDASKGCFVLGVLGDNVNGVIYFIMDADGFQDFVLSCFNLVPSNMSDFSGSVLKNAVYNPMQYVTYCKWFPVMPLGLPSSMTRTVKVGSQNVTVDDGVCYRLTSGYEEEYGIEFTIPVNPDVINDVTNYLKLAPYSQYNVYSRLFGDIPIDSTKIYGFVHLWMIWDVDFTSGKTYMKLANGYNMLTQIGDIVYDNIYSTGVDIPLATLSMSWEAGLGLAGLDFIGNLLPEKVQKSLTVNPNPEIAKKSSGEVASSIWDKFPDMSGNSLADGMMAIDNIVTKNGGGFKGLKNTVKEMLGDVKSAALAAASSSAVESGNDINGTNLVDFIMDAVGSALGQVHTKGTAASFSAYGEAPRMYAWFYKQTPYDVNRFGRPYYRSATLSTLNGFVLCENAYIGTFLGSNATSFDEPPNPLQSEIEILNGLLNSGIYLE